MYILIDKKTKIIKYVSDDNNYGYDTKKMERIKIKGTRADWLKKNGLPQFNFGEELNNKKIIWKQSKKY